MKSLIFLSLCLLAIRAAPNSKVEGEYAKDCDNNLCKIENNCRCASKKGPPTGNLAKYPQLISITVDDAIKTDLYYKIWSPLLTTRKNPDGRPVSATFFVPHEYSDYQRVNDLYNLGFEIGVHSITKNNLQSYWRNASEKTLTEEFGGQKKIISRFANIPAKDIIGVRTPQLQLAGNLSIRAYVASELTYDNSWPTLPKKPLFPYTLDYRSPQDCLLGSKCPNESFKGFWILPMIDLNGKDAQCNVLSSCNITGTADKIATWLWNEVDRVRRETKVPLTLSISSYYFEYTTNSFKAFKIFLDKVAKQKDIFLVSQKQVLDWIKNPKTLSDFETEEPDRNANCDGRNCELRKTSNETRYMSSCVECPSVYPWLGNPEGK